MLPERQHGALTHAILKSESMPSQGLTLTGRVQPSAGVLVLTGHLAWLVLWIVFVLETDRSSW